jgi:hypothetical protein
LPSQAPSVPQPVAPVSWHWSSGSEPAGTDTQEPTVPISAHERQVPLQAVAQQTPWAQNPESQSVPCVQAAPIGNRPQLPAVQVAGDTHCASPEQVVRQSPLPPQMNGAHGSDAPATQMPAPSHFDDSRRVDPVQLPVAHSVPCAYLWQAPAPSQVPSLPQVGAPSSAHSLAGSVPAATGEQVPILPATLQAWQVPLHAVSQQAPSMQWPVAHSPPAVQSAPMDFLGWQIVPTQYAPNAQSALVMQLVRQAPAVQPNGSHAIADAAAHVPLPSHICAAVSMLPVQVAAAQLVPDGYSLQAPVPSQAPLVPQLADP